MFIVNYKDGKPLVEGTLFEGRSLTWDDVPEGIVNVQLAYPFRVQYRDDQGAVIKEAAPVTSIGRYDRYFFYNEAVATSGGTGQLVAKVIAGIDDERKLVVEIRVDAWGNCDVRRYSLLALQKRIEQGQFNPASIKAGAR